MKTSTVPRLNLAPKRRKPLSLWNPLDYLQLMSWMIFSPQSLRWYAETFTVDRSDGGDLRDCKNFQDRWRYWDSMLAVTFLMHWFYLAISGALISTAVFTIFGASISETFGYTSFIALGVFSACLFSPVRVFDGSYLALNDYAKNHIYELLEKDKLWIRIVGLFAVAFVSSAIPEIRDILEPFKSAIEKSGSEHAPWFTLFLWIPFVTTLLISSSIITSVISRFLSDITKGISSIISLTILLLIWFCVLCLSALSDKPAVGSVIFTAISVFLFLFGLFSAYVLIIAVLNALSLRPEHWLFVTLLRILPAYRLRKFSHVTSIPLVGLSTQVSNWLNHDWVVALHNVNELLTHTQQFIPVVMAVNRNLSTLPSDILLIRVSQLAEDPFDWDLIRYASVSLPNDLKVRSIDHLFYLPSSWKRQLQARFNADLRFNTPARATAAGFWYLHDNQPRQAAIAFSAVQHLPHGAEMQQLSHSLDLAINAEQLNLVNGFNIPSSPLLRPDTWNAISQFRSIVDDAQIIDQSHSRSVRSLALAQALGKLTELLKRTDRIPQAERELVIVIAKSWQEKLLAISADVGEVAHTQPVVIPYVAGDPVEGDLFVGRGDVIKQLEELWLMGNQLQSVVLYGHRRMGKTSILKNMSCYLGNNIKVAYVNLLNLGTVSEGAGEVLITLSDEISRTVSIASPKDEDLLRLPYLTFGRFIQSVSSRFKEGQGLIIALDEFEKIEELIASGVLSADFLGFLRGLLQEYPNIAFAFAGLHTLEEMTEDYFNPLFASILPIRIGFFSLGETRQLLANPAEDFTLDYKPETLDEIYRLTAGQPYLTQLVGFQLVRHYNQQVFEEGRERRPIFTPEDLTTVIQHSDFFTKGRYYFTGVWNQAAQDAPGQQAILKVLAADVEGRSPSELQRQTHLSEAIITEALKTLKRHDVVENNQGNWKIIVPLFRQWVTAHQ